MTDHIIGYFKSFFESPSALGVGLAVAFGAIWLACCWRPVFRKPWLWAVLVSSSFLTLVAICFVQIPLQVWAGQALNHFWSQETLIWRKTAIPAVLPVASTSGVSQ